MGAGVFANLAPTRPRRENWPENLEPRLFAAGGSRASDPPASENVGVLSAEWAPAPAPQTPPTASASDRLAITADRLPVGTLLYLVLIGLIAMITVGAFFGGGLLLLAGRGKETVAASKPSSARLDAPRAERAPAALELGLPHSVPAPATADLPLAQHPAVDQAPPLPPAKAVQASPPASPPAVLGGEPAAPKVPAPAPPSSAAVAAIAPADMAAQQPPSSPVDAAPQRSTKPTARDGHGDRAAKAARHSHLRSAHDNRPGAPRRSRSARSSTPAQAGQFNQLLTQLTGQPKPVQPALTPPSADQPDPFAARAAGR